MSDQLGDVIHIETADGNELWFTDPDFKLLAYGNLGAPPTEFITRRGYKQNGSTEIDFLLQSRTISVELWRSAACDRQTYWDNRAALHEFLRPNRNGPLTFTLRTPDGDLRSIIVRADPGLVFPSSQQSNNNWAVQEPLDFIAFNPLFRNAEQSIPTLATGDQEELVFPITFDDSHIVFGLTGLFFSTGTITYGGTWKSYPTITLTGPYTRAVIVNVTTGIVIYMSVPVLSNSQRIITLTPGSQSIVNELGENKFSDLGAGSNLIDFALLPDPEAAGGQQEIQIQLIDGESGVSDANLSYYEQFFAL